MDNRVHVFDRDKIQDEFYTKLGHCLYFYWPKEQPGEPVEGDVIEINKTERMVLAGDRVLVEPNERWRWKVVKTERCSRGEFGKSDHMLVLVK